MPCGIVSVSNKAHGYGLFSRDWLQLLPHYLGLCSLFRHDSYSWDFIALTLAVPVGFINEYPRLSPLIEFAMKEADEHFLLVLHYVALLG